MKAILGEKQGMTQFFAEDGGAHPATMVVAGPVTVVAVKTEAQNGYNAVVLGFGARNKKNINKAQQGQFGEYGDFRYVREFRVDDASNFEVGSTMSASDVLAVDGMVTVSGTSKGKGFQGVVKRHGFAGGRRSHGQKHSEREPGSIGSTGPQRVFKGTKMGGRMGGDRITVKNLRVLAIEGDTLLIKGALPGKPGTLLEIVAE